MEQQAVIQQVPRKSKAGKIFLISIGMIGLGTAGYFLFRNPQKPEEINISEQENEIPALPQPPKHSAPVVSANKNFPIKRGSKGEFVKAVQQVLANKGLLSQADVIGQYGPKTEAALIKGGFPLVISEESFNAITQVKKEPEAAKPEPPIDIDKFAEALRYAAIGKSYDTAISLLKKMRTTADYVAVSEKFKKKPIGTVRKTLVNGMLDAFTTIDQKSEIKKAFTDMGLVYKEGKFSLSGIEGRGIITKSKTTVYDETLCGISVPGNTILGTEAGRRGKYTQFKNREKYFLVPTENINYL